jgi:hypothetical protein
MTFDADQDIRDQNENDNRHVPDIHEMAEAERAKATYGDMIDALDSDMKTDKVFQPSLELLLQGSDDMELGRMIRCSLQRYFRGVAEMKS